VVGHVVSTVWFAIKHCSDIIPRDAIAWLRVLDSNDTQSSIIAMLHKGGVDSLHDEFAIVTLDVLLSLRERGLLVHFDEVWLFASTPTPDTLRLLPSIAMTGDVGPITERSHDAAIIDALTIRESLIAVLGDGDGLNFYCRDESLGRCVRDSAAACVK
jgi:hypothetical protein